VGVDAARDVAGDRRPRAGLRLSRQQRLAESIRILFGTIAFFVFLIAPPLVALVPFFISGALPGGLRDPLQRDRLR
jgi:hypothetical protein